MEVAYEHLWAAGYDLPPDATILKPRDGGKTTALPMVVAPRRGKKVAKAKRQKASK